MSNVFTDDDEPDQDDDEFQDDTPVITTLRKRLREAEKKGRRTDELETELAGYRAKEALAAAGLNLNERQQRALIRELDGDLNADTARTAAIELGFITDEQAETDAAEAEAQRQMAAASAGASTNRGDGMVTAQEYGEWDAPRRQAFQQSHPDALKAFQRGESVRA